MTEHDGPDEPAAAERSAIDLTLPQADAACAVAGDADLVLVVGPAGTGKTTALVISGEPFEVRGGVCELEKSIRAKLNRGRRWATVDRI